MDTVDRLVSVGLVLVVEVVGDNETWQELSVVDLSVDLVEFVDSLRSHHWIVDWT